MRDNPPYDSTKGIARKNDESEVNSLRLDLSALARGPGRL